MLAIALRALVLLIGGAAAGLGWNLARNPAFDWRHGGASGQCAAPTAEPVIVQPTEIAHLCGTDGVVVADARPSNAFAEGHIAGAIHLPCGAAGVMAEEALGRLSGARTVLVYGHDTDEALPVARSLVAQHLADVRVIAGGFSSWSAAGLACASGPCPGCKESGSPGAAHGHPEAAH